MTGLPSSCLKYRSRIDHVINVAPVIWINVFAPGGVLYSATKAAGRVLTEGFGSRP
jgi:hypothetical protein